MEKKAGNRSKRRKERRKRCTEGGAKVGVLGDGARKGNNQYRRKEGKGRKRRSLGEEEEGEGGVWETCDFSAPPSDAKLWRWVMLKEAQAAL